MVRTGAATIGSHEKSTPSPLCVAVDTYAGEVGRIFVVSAVVVGVPFGGKVS